MQASPRPPDLGNVRDVHLIDAVGLEAIGLLHWLTAQASPTQDLPGGWAYSNGVREMTRALGIGNDKLMRLTAALQAAGLLYIEPGRRYGRGGGSTKNRYWLTFDPAVPSPRGPRPAFTTPHDSPLSTGTNGGFQDGNLQGGNRHLTSVREAHTPVSAPVAGTWPISAHPVDDGSYLQKAASPPEGERTTTSDRQGAPKTPKFLLEALRDVGWQGAPPDGDPLVISVVAKHLATSGTWANPAGQLNKLITQGKLEDYAELHTLLTTDPTGALTEYRDTAPSTAAMAYPELCERQNEHPDWYAMVLTEATRLASMRGEKVSMMLIRETAAAIPPPGQEDSQARTS